MRGFEAERDQRRAELRRKAVERSRARRKRGDDSAMRGMVTARCRDGHKWRHVLGDPPGTCPSCGKPPNGRAA